MNNKLKKIQKYNRLYLRLNSHSKDLKYWENTFIFEENTRVIDSSSILLYQLDANNTLNVPKKMGICYGKKRKTL